LHPPTIDRLFIWLNLPHAAIDAQLGPVTKLAASLRENIAAAATSSARVMRSSWTGAISTCRSAVEQRHDPVLRHTLIRYCLPFDCVAFRTA
jgi:hypothetical protein